MDGCRNVFGVKKKVIFRLGLMMLRVNVGIVLFDSIIVLSYEVEYWRRWGRRVRRSLVC